MAPAGFGNQRADVEGPEATLYGETRATGLTFAENATVATRATDVSFAKSKTTGYGPLNETKFALVSRFHVMIDKYDLGMWSKVDGISVKFDTEDYPELGQNAYMKQLPKRTTYTPVKLTRGVSAASSGTVQKWLASNRDATEETSMKITVFDAWVQEVIHWTFRHVVVLSWKAGGLDAATQKVATEELELRHEGFL